MHACPCLSEGACPTCKGLGFTFMEMYFLESVRSKCRTCGGKRFTEKVLALKYHDKNIAEVLNMSISEATAFFAEQPNIHKKLAGMLPHPVAGSQEQKYWL